MAADDTHGSAWQRRSLELMADIRTWSQAALVAEATRRFGPDSMVWPFVCPICTTVATGCDFRRLGVSARLAGQSCIGRTSMEPEAVRARGCDYTAGGLITAPWTVVFGANVVLAPGEAVPVFPLAEARDLAGYEPVPAYTGTGAGVPA